MIPPPSPAPSQSRVPASLALVVVVAVALAGCGVTSLSFATPPDTPPSSTTSTTLAPDLTGAPEAAVSGQTTTTAPAIGPGHATLNGTVLGPNGPVAGATVEADRIVGDAQASIQAVTRPDGSWTIPSILGGRYRVRAWQTPTLAMTDPQIFFLGGSESHSVNLQLQSFTGQQVSSGVDPPVAVVGGSIAVVVAVTTQTVDSQGIVSYQPAPNVAVTLSVGAAAAVGANPATTDSTGQAQFQVTCVSAGDASVSASTASGTSSQNSVTCEQPYIPPVTPPPTTAPPPSSTTTTSTTVPPSTSTTKPGH